MDTPYTVLTPGPVPIPKAVREILAKPAEHHRTPEFVAALGRVLQNLKTVFATRETVYLHAATGSGAMESALVNIASPGDEVLLVVSGKFGERWAEMAAAYGLRAHRLDVAWGKSVRADEVAEKLRQHPGVRAVFCQACETSTGALHPVREIAQAVKASGALFVVDAITALATTDLRMDEWGIDVMVAGSQKAFMLPTGLSFLAFSPKAWRAVETAKLPRYYFDVRREKKSYANGETHFSTPVQLVRALEWVLEQWSLPGGLEKAQKRVQALARATRQGLAELNLKSFAETPGPALTAIALPSEVDGQKLRADMEKTDKVVVMGGQDQLKGKILRVGHMGAVEDSDMLRFFDSLYRGLQASAAAGSLSTVHLDRAKQSFLAEVARP